MSCAAVAVAVLYHLPLRDPDGVAGPTYVRLPLILLLAFLADVLPRTLARTLRRAPDAAGRWRRLPATFAAVTRERWP